MVYLQFKSKVTEALPLPPLPNKKKEKRRGKATAERGLLVICSLN